MATRNQVLSMFGASPEQIMERQRQEQAEMLQQIRDPYQQTGMAIGTMLGRALGGESPEVERARRLQQTLQGVDMTNPEQMTQAASILNKAGFANEALQLLSRADEFKTSAQQRATSEAREQAAEAELKRGRYETTQETEAVPVTVDGQTYYVSVNARVRYDKDTGERKVLTSQDQLTKLGEQQAQKMKREELASQSESTLRQAQLTAARKQATLAEAQLTANQKKAGETTGLVRVPIQREEFDPLTQRTTKVTGFEYKVATGTMTTDESGKKIFVPNMQLPPDAEVVDEKGLPQGAVEIQQDREMTITNTSGQEFIKIIDGENEKFYQVITEGDVKYYLPTPVNPGTILNQPAEEQPSTQSNLGRKGQMSRGTTMTEQPVISSPPRTRRKR